MNKLIIISGCSSGGKSTLLSELKRRGYTTIPEAGRELVKEQLAVCSAITPWSKPVEFCKLLIERSVAAYHSAQELTQVKDNMIFFDRSFLEGVSYCQSIGIHQYDHFVDELRYYPTIFMAPPWKEIFEQDDERKHPFEDAVTEYGRDVPFFTQCGYCLVELPKNSVKERAEFILSAVYRK